MSSPAPPKLITLNHYNGNVEIYLAAIYQSYKDEIVNAKLFFLELPIRCQFKPAYKNMHFGFWHLVSTGEREENRKIDFRRCERIDWVAFILRNANDTSMIHCWENLRFGNTHIVLWLHQHNFLVILAKRKNYLVLKTAYPVTETYRIKKLNKEMKNSVDPRKARVAFEATPDTLSTLTLSDGR